MYWLLTFDMLLVLKEAEEGSVFLLITVSSHQHIYVQYVYRNRSTSDAHAQVLESDWTNVVTHNVTTPHNVKTAHNVNNYKCKYYIITMMKCS